MSTQSPASRLLDGFDGQQWVSYAHAARELGVSVETVLRLTRNLIDSGLREVRDVESCFLECQRRNRHLIPKEK